MKRNVKVTVTVEVEVDETKFTPEFMEEFRGYMYKFNSVEEHMSHLAEQRAIGQWSGFIEGYGPPEEMGIKTMIIEYETEIVDV